MVPLLWEREHPISAPKSGPVGDYAPACMSHLEDRNTDNATLLFSLFCFWVFGFFFSFSIDCSEKHTQCSIDMVSICFRKTKVDMSYMA